MDLTDLDVREPYCKVLHLLRILSILQFVNPYERILEVRFANPMQSHVLVPSESNQPKYVDLVFISILRSNDASCGIGTAHLRVHYSEICAKLFLREQE